MNGPTGIVVAAGKGVLRTMYCKDEMNCDTIPVDIATNGLIIVAKELGTSSHCEQNNEDRKAMFVNLSTGNVSYFYRIRTIDEFC